MKKLAIPFLTILLTGCYSLPNIPGFNQDIWQVPITYCDQDKMDLANILVEHKDQLLGEGQTQIKKLLGQPDEHELYKRTEKFFYYNLTPGDTCDIETPRRLSIRFDALDRAKEVMIIE
ncbi:MAG: hypothetical protein CMP48_11370 [Rickettsiales bacterium]|nr:hypothetical protein [Rickettsiales bacterium]